MQLPDLDIHHHQTVRRRRFAGFIGILISIGLLLSVAIYAYDLHLSPLTRIKTIINGPPTSTSTPIVTCKTPYHDPGDSTASIISGGIQRTMLIHLAPSYGIQPQALVVNYHGYNFTAQHMARYSNMATEANMADFILVFPEGVDSPPSWNAGLGAQGPTGSADDVQFTRDMLKYLEKDYCVDVHRVYVTGFSLGGGMAYRIACTLSDQIAAIATVAGAFYHAPGGCQPSRPIPVLEIHGQADQDAPYNGNPAMGMAAVQVYLNVWLGHDQCSGSSQVIFKQADVTGMEWKQCADNTVVIHYRISDGGHTWPGGGSITSLGYTTHTIDANVVIWKFFSQYKTP
jgi:polyhydroxybutyrate depolymerase